MVLTTSVASMTSTASLASKKSKSACTLFTGWFPCHQEPNQPQWPQQPQRPQWPQWPKQPNFIKTLTEHDVAINLTTKWHILVSQCGMDHQKSTILWIFSHSGRWRLWTPWMLLSTKSTGHKSKFRISWTYRFCYYVHFWWPNKCLKCIISSLNTLYIVTLARN